MLPITNKNKGFQALTSLVKSQSKNAMSGNPLLVGIFSPAISQPLTSRQHTQRVIFRLFGEHVQNQRKRLILKAFC